MEKDQKKYSAQKIHCGRRISHSTVHNSNFDEILFPRAKYQVNFRFFFTRNKCRKVGSIGDAWMSSIVDDSFFRTNEKHRFYAEECKSTFGRNTFAIDAFIRAVHCRFLRPATDERFARSTFLYFA